MLEDGRVVIPIWTTGEPFYAYPGAQPRCRGTYELLFLAEDGSTVRHVAGDSRGSTDDSDLTPRTRDQKLLRMGTEVCGRLMSPYGYSGTVLFDGNTTFGRLLRMVVLDDHTTAVLVQHTTG